MPSSVSSSDDEGLTCLLDIVGGDSDLTITTVKEDIDEEHILQLRNLVQHIQMHDPVEIEEIKKPKSAAPKEINLLDQVELLKQEICSLLMEREAVSATVGSEREGGREAELRAELAESREKVDNAKASKEQLKELYMERNRDKVRTGAVASKEEFTRMKEEYFK